MQHHTGTHPMSKPGIILLADKAGCLNDFSAEFMPLPEFNAALEPLLSSSLECFVVLSGSDPLWEAHLDTLGIDWGVCPDAHQGISACTAFGVHSTQSWQGWILDIATMPATPTQLYQALSRATGRYPITSIQNRQGKRYFPIAFDSRYGYELMQPDNLLLAQTLKGHPSDAQMQWLSLEFAAPLPEPRQTPISI